MTNEIEQYTKEKNHFSAQQHKKNPNLLQYLQNRFSAHVVGYRDKKLVLFFS